MWIAFGICRICTATDACEGATSAHSSADVRLTCAGLLGSNWLYLLDMAKKNVLQPNAIVIPAAATLYCAGIEARTGDVAGFDFSAFNKYRCCSHSFHSIKKLPHACHGCCISAMLKCLHQVVRDGSVPKNF